MEYGNIFYFANINKIGGVETFFYEIAKKYNNYDITIFYKNGDKNQIERLQKLVRIKKWNSKYEGIKCKKAFWSYNSADILEKVNAEKNYGLIHADFEKMPPGTKPFIHSKIDEYIGVTQAVCDSFTRLTGMPCTLCYNPFTLTSFQEKKKLKLVSATRLSNEKGKWRIIELARLLDEAKIPYKWIIFTTDKNVIDNPNIIYKEPLLDIYQYFKQADYVVQLSDTEAYCYTMIESLSIGTPVIVCNWPCLKELGINENNSFILPLDMKNIPIQKIYTKKFNFTYKAPADNWENILNQTKSSYKEELKTLYEVEALDTYENENRPDGQLGRVPKRGEKWWINKNRLDILLGENKFKKTYIKTTGNVKREE